MAEVEANLDQMMDLIKKLDPRDGEVIANAMEEIERSRKQAKNLQHYGKWYQWLRDRIVFRTNWTDEKRTFLEIAGSTFLLGSHLNKTHDSVDDWVKEAMKAEQKWGKGKK
jgi:hypothetical protein